MLYFLLLICFVPSAFIAKTSKGGREKVDKDRSFINPLKVFLSSDDHVPYMMMATLKSPGQAPTKLDGSCQLHLSSLVY